jgi:MFS family permease
LIISASVGSMIYGITIGWSSPNAPKLIESLDSVDFWITKNEYSWIVGSMALGGALTALLSGFVRNRIGTKLTILTFGTCGSFGWLSIIFAINVKMLIIGRFLTGVAIGCYCYIIPIYIGEISTNETRGKMLSTFQIMLNVGMCFSFAVGKYANFIQYNMICGFLPSVFYSLAMSFLPESPIFLMSKNCEILARESLKILRDPGCDIDNEINGMRTNLLERSKQKSLISTVLSSVATRKAFIIVLVQFFFYQMSGVNALAFYATPIFIESEINIDPYSAIVFVSAIQVMVAFSVIILVDKFGRLFLLISSEVIMWLGMTGLGIYFVLKEQNYDLTSFKWIPVLCVGACSIAFTFGLGPVSVILLGELFSQSAKVIVAPIGQFVNFMLIFVVGFTFLMLTTVLGSGLTFLMYSVFIFLALCFSIFFIPETKGLSLLEIQNLLESKK